MPPFNPISHKKLVQNLKQLGFDGPYSGGKHLFMIKGDLRLTVPNHHRSDIGIGLLSKILKQADISKEEWLSL